MEGVALFPSRLLSILALVAIGALFSGCSGPQWPKCENDDHCKADKEGNPTGRDLICVFGQCQECGKDADCEEGHRCNKGRCERLCTSDEECGTGMQCNEQGDCVKAAPTAKKPECVEDGDCKTGFSCSDDGRCVEAVVDDEGPTCAREARVHFEFNVYDLTPEAREVLDRFAECLKKNASWRVTIEGHADERGTTQYNLDLGEKRARSVQDYLVRLGVERSRLRTISYGEERPLVNRSDEEAWAMNRRGELIVKVD